MLAGRALSAAPASHAPSIGNLGAGREIAVRCGLRRSLGDDATGMHDLLAHAPDAYFAGV